MWNSPKFILKFSKLRWWGSFENIKIKQGPTSRNSEIEKQHSIKLIVWKIYFNKFFYSGRFTARFKSTIQFLLKIIIHSNHGTNKYFRDKIPVRVYKGVESEPIFPASCEILNIHSIVPIYEKNCVNSSWFSQKPKLFSDRVT